MNAPKEIRWGRWVLVAGLLALLLHLTRYDRRVVMQQGSPTVIEIDRWTGRSTYSTPELKSDPWWWER